MALFAGAAAAAAAEGYWLTERRGTGTDEGVVTAVYAEAPLTTTARRWSRAALVVRCDEANGAGARPVMRVALSAEPAALFDLDGAMLRLAYRVDGGVERSLGAWQAGPGAGPGAGTLRFYPHALLPAGGHRGAAGGRLFADMRRGDELTVDFVDRDGRRVARILLRLEGFAERFDRLEGACGPPPG